MDRNTTEEVRCVGNKVCLILWIKENHMPLQKCWSAFKTSFFSHKGLEICSDTWTSIDWCGKIPEFLIPLRTEGNTLTCSLLPLPIATFKTSEVLIT